MKKLLYIVLLMVGHSGSVFASSKKEKQLKDFVYYTFVDHDTNLAWSSTLPGTYSNGCVQLKKKKFYYAANKCTTVVGSDGKLQVRIEDSAAALACKKIGARLPTRSEYESLIKKFSHTESSNQGLQLTKKGVQDMALVLGHITAEFWTSSVVYSNDYQPPKYFPQSAFTFTGEIVSAGITSNERFATHKYVRCVTEHPQP